MCLGAVIRGATPHFDYVCGETAKGVANVALQTGVPCIFGVLTTNSIEEAVERAGTKAGNKGYDAAVGAIEMATLLRQIDATAGKTPRPSPPGPPVVRCDTARPRHSQQRRTAAAR